jgi:uncharacterized NAD(P)/FAD-binding protein YdhS
MKKIGIIGAGFSGTMTAIHLVSNATSATAVHLINQHDSLNKGVAYNPYSKKQLLNVVTSRMSAFLSEPSHFLDWVLQHPGYRDKDPSLIAESFLPRYLYGEYLSDLWEKTVSGNLNPHAAVNVVNDSVSALRKSGTGYTIELDSGERLEVDHCVIASGNNLPGHPKIDDTRFFSSKNYFQNPWDRSTVLDTDPDLPVLIVGNGLTMVDTVIGLLENHFPNKIISISPNGFNILPHRHSNFKYAKMIEEMKAEVTLHQLVALFNKHVKKLTVFGLSAEPIIDAMRPHTSRIWQQMTLREKRTFMGRLRHLWGVARHRIPPHIHDLMQQLQIEGRLKIYSGKLISLADDGPGVQVRFFNKKNRALEEIVVSRVINCTGPETDFTRLKNNFLSQSLRDGLISQDELKLGINTDVQTFEVIGVDGKTQQNLYTLGGHLKGMLWESTAVAEIREQAERLAKLILLKS